MLISFAFLLLAVVHLLPAGPMFDPRALTRLYGVAAEDSTMLVLLRHRAALLALVGLLCAWAAFAPSIRPATIFAAGFNIVSFLVMFAVYGAPPGPLRTVALVDAMAIAPWVLAAWKTLAEH